MARWKVTVRNGPAVSRSAHDELDAALAAARDEADRITAEPPLKGVSAIREYGPARQTRARIEISGKGLLKPPTGGVDLKGDNSVVGYTGGVRRRPLPAKDLDGVFRELRRVLADE